MKAKIHILLLLAILTIQFSCAQKNNNINSTVALPFNQEVWKIMDKGRAEHSIDTTIYDGKMALHLPLGHTAYLNNKEFENFEMEFDVIGFVMPGVGFRGQDANNYELVYLRIMSNNKKDALQYLPIYNGSLPWQLYNYPKYEAVATFDERKEGTVPLSFDKYLKKGIINGSLKIKLGNLGINFSSKAQLQFINEDTWGIGDIEQLKGGFLRKATSGWELWNPYVWSHVKIRVIGEHAAVYVGDMNEPKMMVKLKLGTRSGNISLRNQFFDAFFANVTIKELKDSVSKISDEEFRTESGNYLKKWKLSPKFIKRDSVILSQLDSMQKSKILWEEIVADEDGLVNLSRFMDVMSQSVVLKTNIVSQSNQTLKMHFGFAKHMIVILNDSIIFKKEMDVTKEEGRVFVDNETVDLNLKHGRNELFLVLTGDEEYHQNWGMISLLENMEGIEIE